MRRLLIFFLLALPLAASADREEINLAGTWKFQADVMDFIDAPGEIRNKPELQGNIQLPGTTDENGIGFRNPYRYLTHLTRKFEYNAPAWYQRHVQVPASWAGKQIFLYIERTQWLSEVYVAGKKISASDYVSVPHIHDLTRAIRAGEDNNIYVRVDNRYQYNVHKWSHGHTEHTQINWNGMLGEIKLVAVDPVYIQDMQVYPDAMKRTATLRLTIVNTTGKPQTANVNFGIANTRYAGSLANMSLPDSVNTVTQTLQLGKDIRIWDEFTPSLYRMSCTLSSGSFADRQTVTFGLRTISQQGENILLNGHRIHLRGTVGNAIMPKTGYLSTEEGPWRHILSTLKQYGMNHLRCHTFCPPDACFRVADSLGVYLEVEMPMWGVDALPGDSAREAFFSREMEAILRTYGNHPSFLLYCNGNEMNGQLAFPEALIRRGKQLDNRHLFAASTARKRTPEDQFYISHQTQNGRVAVYNGRPMTDYDMNAGYGTDVPVISHESGQMCTFPDINNTKDYTGPVEPRNFDIYRDSLRAHGLLDQVSDFVRVSNKMTAIEYKDVIEAQLRTSRSSGFELLSLNDYPGQGYAPVGVLDAFWNSKGAITAEEFRRFCAPVVPLLRFAKRSFFSGETFEARAEVYNYSNSALRSPRVRWTATNAEGKVVASGRLKAGPIGDYAVSSIGRFRFPLGTVTTPQKLTVTLSVGNRSNAWDIWVFPHHDMQEMLHSSGDFLFTRELDDQALQYLREGKTVTLFARPDSVRGRKSTFHNFFWNPVMFHWDPLIISTLIHNSHPALAQFPTEANLDWQWYDIMTHAKVIELDGAPQSLCPFIQPIDSYAEDHRLGIAFEARVGKGRLMLVALDTETDIDRRPATQQLVYSITRYVRLSSAFNPKVELTEGFLRSFMKTSLTSTKRDDAMMEYYNGAK